MKPLIRMSWGLAVASLVLAGGSATAGTLEVKVPFPFVVRGRTLPAGQYHLQNDEGIVRLFDERGTGASAIVMTRPAAGHDPAGNKPALTFQRYEQQYRLVGIWEGADEGLAVAGS